MHTTLELSKTTSLSCTTKLSSFKHQNTQLKNSDRLKASIMAFATFNLHLVVVFAILGLQLCSGYRCSSQGCQCIPSKRLITCAGRNMVHYPQFITTHGFSTLDLRNNKLRQLPTVSYVHRFKTVDLRNNPLRCQTEEKYYFQVVSTILIQTQCSTPQYNSTVEKEKTDVNSSNRILSTKTGKNQPTFTTNDAQSTPVVTIALSTTGSIGLVILLSTVITIYMKREKYHQTLASLRKSPSNGSSLSITSSNVSGEGELVNVAVPPPRPPPPLHPPPRTHALSHHLSVQHMTSLPASVQPASQQPPALLSQISPVPPSASQQPPALLSQISPVSPTPVQPQVPPSSASATLPNQPSTSTSPGHSLQSQEVENMDVDSDMEKPVKMRKCKAKNTKRLHKASPPYKARLPPKKKRKK